MKNQMIQQNGNRFLLRDKVAVIFGAGRAIGSQVAREFSNEGATLFLSGRHLESAEKVSKEIRVYREAEAEQVDALDEKAVNAYLDRVAKQVGSIDIISFKTLKQLFCVYFGSMKGTDVSF
jgi:NADP-dependent 3-hydroxy acid dehydrogenase YdfG